MTLDDDRRKSTALMIIIEKMVARYQNEHRGNLDEEIFRLFEKAKKVKRAENRVDLDVAIKDI